MATRRIVLGEADVRERLSAACVAAGGQRRFAAAAGLSEGYVSNVKRGHKPAGDAILELLGLREERAYVEREARS